MAAQRAKFMTGCAANNIPEKKAERIFNLMEEFAGYGFNKSHSCAYALLAYQTAYLKTHYPVEFMAALLTSDARRSRMWERTPPRRFVSRACSKENFSRFMSSANGSRRVFSTSASLRA